MPKSSVKSYALRLLSLITFVLLLASRAWAGSTTVVISQIYTAGGNSGATYNADYVELFNLSATTQSLNGFALQYASAAGTTGTVIALPAGISLAPGQHYLIRGTPSTTNGIDTPNAADVTLSGLAAGASAGKLYLTSSSVALTDVCTGATIVDFVGYGSTASCYEGTKYAPTPTTTLASIRANNGCQDTNDNGADFATGTPAPRNSSNTPTPCSGAVTSTGLTLAAAANPTSVYQGSTTLLTGKLTAGTNPASTGIAVTANLSALGGSATQPLYDDGTHGDATAGDGTYSYTLTVPTNAPLGSNSITLAASDAQARSATASVSITVLAPVVLVPIHTIQGSTPGTAAYAGQTVITTGIVTGVTANGFYIQAKDTDADTNAATPEGIFVHTGTGNVPATATIGTNLQLTGTVTLYPTTSLIPGTELDSPTAYTVLSTGNALPTAITLTTANLTPSGGFAQLQRLQSMRVAVPSLTVTGPTQGTLTETAETYVSNGQFYGTVTGNARPVREPGLEILDPLTPSQPVTIARFDDNPEVFELDSAAMLPSPGPIDVADLATLTGVSGVMDFSSGAPVLLIDAATRPTVAGGLTVVPVAAQRSNEITIGDQNIERFYDVAKETTGATAVTATAYALRLSKVSLAVRNVLLTPDILCLEEVENIQTLTDIANKITTDAVAAGKTDPAYAPYLVQGNDTSGINVAFLIKTSKVTVKDVSQFGKTTTFTQPSTGSSALLNDRPPLVLHAGLKRPGGAADYPLTVIVNHLRSLNNVTDQTGTGQNARAKREQQAEFLANLVQGYQAAGEHVVVLGDLNAFEFNDGIVDSIGIIKGSAAPASQDILAGPSGLVTPNLVDLAPTNVATNTYSYVYEGNAQSIDHILATQDIAGSMRTSPAHYNADFPVIYRNDQTRPEAGSDHDGIVAYLTVPGLSVLSFNPNSLTFASQPLKTTSSTQTIAVTNNGTTAITFTSIVASSGFAATSACGSSLAAGGSCNVSVTFTPAATGPINGTLTFTDSDPTGTQTVALTGTGAGIYSTASLTTSTTNTVTGKPVVLTATIAGNAGTTPTGTVTFYDGSTAISGAVMLAGGTASYTASNLGIAVHNLTAVYSGDATYPMSTSAVVAVTIVAAPVADFTLVIANPVLPVTAANPVASTNVVVGFENGFNSAVTLTCSGLPANSTCTFAPATLNASGTSLLSVRINTASAALNKLPIGGFGASGVMAAFGLLTLPLCFNRKRRAGLQHALRMAAIVLLLGSGALVVSGCSTNATNTGSSTVTVTATGGSVTHTGTFTLMVQ